MTWRNPYDQDENLAVSEETGLACDPEDDYAVQSGKDEADINALVARYHLMGEMPPPPDKAPFYGDFTQVTDFRSALEAMALAEERFSELPSLVRARFQNDPAELIDFVLDPANRAEAIKIGLLEEPEASPVVSPSAPSA